MNVLGPNTNASLELLQPHCILCCGEDVSHFLHLLPTIQMYHEYRGYRFWRLPGFTLVLSGMGTGCVEPLDLGTDTAESRARDRPDRQRGKNARGGGDARAAVLDRSCASSRGRDWTAKTWLSR